MSQSQAVEERSGAAHQHTHTYSRIRKKKKDEAKEEFEEIEGEKGRCDDDDETTNERDCYAQLRVKSLYYVCVCVCVHLYSLQWSEGGGSQVIAQKVGPPCDTALQRQFRSITLRRGQQRSSPPSPDAPKHAYVCVFKMNIHTQIFAGHTHAFPSYLAIEGEKKELLNVKTNRKRKTREKRS
jgi:hypothetical protein